MTITCEADAEHDGETIQMRDPRRPDGSVARHTSEVCSMLSKNRNPGSCRPLRALGAATLQVGQVNRERSRGQWQWFLLLAISACAVLVPVGLAAAACPKPLPPCESMVAVAGSVRAKGAVANCARKTPICTTTTSKKGLRGLRGVTDRKSVV